jgi:superfamily II DNA helicase RecQ
MNTKIFTFSFDEKSGGFLTASFDVFCKQNLILDAHTHFFVKNNEPYWTIAVQYELKSGARTQKTESILPETKLFLQLRAWRNQRSKISGGPPYIIATNKQLLLLEQLKPKSLVELKQVKGFGAKKIEAYGKEILSIIENAEKNEPSK